MSWQTINLTLPPSIAAIAADAGGFVSQVPAAMDTATGLADSLGGSFSHHPLAGTAAGIDTTLLDALLSPAVHRSHVHPWLPGANQGGSLMAFLAGRNAVGMLADKLADFSSVNLLGESAEVLTLVFSGADHAVLADALAAFTAVLPLPELMMVQRRCELIAGHQRSKLTVPDEPLQPWWHSQTAKNHMAMDDAARLLGDQQAMVEAYAADAGNPKEELKTLISKKKAKAQAMAADWSAFNALFTGGAGQAFFQQAGHPVNLGGNLRQAAESLNELPVATAVMLAGGAGDLSVLQEAVGYAA